MKELLSKRLQLWTRLKDGRLVPLKEERLLSMLLDMQASFSTREAVKPRFSPLEAAKLAKSMPEV